MKHINTSEELYEAINAKGALTAYFYNDTCAPCVVLRPKVKMMIEKEFPKMEVLFINVITFPELAGKFSVFASPTIIIFFDGKENFRLSKHVSITELSDRISRLYRLFYSSDSK